MMLFILEYRLDVLLWALLAVLLAIGAECWLRYRRQAGGLPRLSWLLLIGLTVLAAIGAEHDGARRRDHLRQMVAGLAPTYAQELQRHGHARVSLDTPPDDPTYLDLIRSQKEWLAVNPSVADIYTLRPDREGTFRFIVDSETDYDGNRRIEGSREERTEIGEAYEDVNGALNLALSGRTIFDDRPVQDRWGVWVSAYAPIRDAQGQVEAIVGVDYPAEKWVASIAEARRSSLMTLALFALLVVAGSGAYQDARAEIARRLAYERELHSAQLAAQQANAAKSQFLANMSHELRTPLTTILGYGEYLRKQLGEFHDVPRLMDACDAIHTSGEHLLGLINDLLDLSKIEAGKLTVERLPVSPRRLLADVESALRIKAVTKGLRLAVETLGPLPECIDTDPLRLKQILLNLIGNAIKFTERGQITVTAYYHQDQARLQIVVADTGIGLTREELAILFRPFTQADASTTRRFGGTGLGLTISRHLARSLGGDITVASEPGSGSRFTMTIEAPQAAVTAADTSPQPAAESPGAPTVREERPLACRVLLAEDSPENQRLISMLLVQAGADVVAVDNGVQCVEAALAAEEAGDPFDLVLTDIQMPLLDGFHVARRLRAAGFTRPIAALTANAMPQDREQCLTAGCDEHIAKPIQKDQLLATVARLAGRLSAALAD